MEVGVGVGVSDVDTVGLLTGGWVPAWCTDPFWARVGILLIQLWLGMPYMFIIVTGALQSLPTDVYEAADLDGSHVFNVKRVVIFLDRVVGKRHFCPDTPFKQSIVVAIKLLADGDAL